MEYRERRDGLRGRLSGCFHLQTVHPGASGLTEEDWGRDNSGAVGALASESWERTVNVYDGIKLSSTSVFSSLT